MIQFTEKDLLITLMTSGVISYAWSAFVTPCNNHLSGNIGEYTPRLIEKIGLDSYSWLIGPHKSKKYTCSEIKEIEVKYKRKLKEIKAAI